MLGWSELPSLPETHVLCPCFCGGLLPSPPLHLSLSLSPSPDHRLHEEGKACNPPFFNLMALAILYLLSIFVFLLPNIPVHALGSSSTAAVIYGTSTVCGIVAAKPTRRILCFRGGLVIQVQPNVSFDAISGGKNFFCGLTSRGYTILCWDTRFSRTSFQPQRIYHSDSVPLTDLAVGNDHVCAREVNSGIAKCWRGASIAGSPFPSPGKSLNFKTITSGSGFSCGIARGKSNVFCWGHNVIGNEIQKQFNNVSMATIVAGESRVCGLTTNGLLVCKGSGKLHIPSSSSANEFSSIAMGGNFSCAVRETTGELSCWGETAGIKTGIDLPFEFVIAGLDFICGLKTSNLTIICWGNGWSYETHLQQTLPLGMIIPGPCLHSSCGMCGMYPNSDTLCHGSGNICKTCKAQLPLPVPLPPLSPSSSFHPSRAKTKLNWAFLIVGSIGAFVGFCSLLYCLRCGFRRKKNDFVLPASVQVAMDLDNAAVRTSRNGSNIVRLSSFSGKRHSSRMLRRDRSGSTGQSGGTLRWERTGSSSKHSERTQIFSFSDLAAATNNFSPENKIGAGSFGVVYKGTLADGREVAIKRAETNSKTKKFMEKENAFDSELALLSRLHHKHLVGLIGFCEENEERLLVYEHMKNGSLHDQLHNKKNSDIVLNSWKIRIKVALDAARGVDYLHNYAVPPIIHRDIKSSNILIDSNWTARVSDFGLSLMGPVSELERLRTRAVGTIGYIDPEYYVSNVLTAKSDIYGLGVVLLELLTGKKAVFKEEDGKAPVGVVEFAGPRILDGEMGSALDKRVGQPDLNEKEAVELFAYTAMHCVNYEGKERPTIIDVVANLERALGLCQDNRLSFSTITLSCSSD